MRMHVMRLVINLLFFLNIYIYYFLFFPVMYGGSFKMTQMYLEFGLF